jgi:hypothetical protein
VASQAIVVSIEPSQRGDASVNRYFLSLTLVQGAVIAWLVAAAVQTFTALATLAATAIGLVSAGTFVAATVDSIADG